MQSIVQERGRVQFPQFTGERVYMREFTKGAGLPADLFRWQRTVDAMLDGVDVDGPIYLMVDQAPVKAGNLHRRGGLHIDGYWIPAKQAHGNPAPYHSVTPPERGRHVHASGDHGHRISPDGEWPVESLILASNIAASRAFMGEYFGNPKDGGDCSHIDTSGMQEILQESGFTYAGNVTMLHESLPMSVDCLRTVVRLNVPGWSPT